MAANLLSVRIEKLGPIYDLEKEQKKSIAECGFQWVAIVAVVVVVVHNGRKMDPKGTFVRLFVQPLS